MGGSLRPAIDIALENAQHNIGQRVYSAVGGRFRDYFDTAPILAAL